MNPHIENISEKKNALTFTLSGVNVSLANAVRRTILSDIPQVIFRTAPYEESKATIHVNTTRLNNEIIKQRLSCIPIHIKNFDDIPLKNYLLEVNVENTTENVIYVTTEDFKILNVETKQYLSESDTRTIFPANDYTGNFIDFVRLRPKISNEIPGEKIHLTCKFDIGTAKEDAMFNVVSTCSYQMTPDTEKMETQLAKKVQGWKDEGRNAEVIEFEKENWKLLDGLRIVRPNSFDFIVESVGVFTNQEIILQSCDIIMKKLKELDHAIDTDDETVLKIVNSENTMANCFDVLLEKEDYTIGKSLEFVLYDKYFEGMKTLTFCGFKKQHPHDDGSVIRLAYLEPIERSGVKQNLKEAISDSISVFNKIKKEFLRTVK